MTTPPPSPPSRPQVTTLAPSPITLAPFDIDRLVSKYQLTDAEKHILESLRIDENSRDQISSYDQKTDAWLQARVYRLTASRFGAARRHCQYTSPKQLLKDLLWNEFKGNVATAYGEEYEEVALAIYEKCKAKSGKPVTVTRPGLIVSLEHPWIGVSVDGLVRDDSENEGRRNGGLEIKCPFGKQLYSFIPSQYYDQIQGAMGILGLPWWDFVVYAPHHIQIRRYDFDATYYNTELFPRLEEFYMREYLPRIVLQQQGLLNHGQIDAGAVAKPKRKRTVNPKSVKETKSTGMCLPGVFNIFISDPSADISTDENAEIPINSILN